MLLSWCVRSDDLTRFRHHRTVRAQAVQWGGPLTGRQATVLSSQVHTRSVSPSSPLSFGLRPL